MNTVGRQDLRGPHFLSVLAAAALCLTQCNTPRAPSQTLYLYRFAHLGILNMFSGTCSLLTPDTVKPDTVHMSLPAMRKPIDAFPVFCMLRLTNASMREEHTC